MYLAVYSPHWQGTGDYFRDKDVRRIEGQKDPESRRGHHATSSWVVKPHVRFVGGFCMGQRDVFTLNAKNALDTGMCDLSKLVYAHRTQRTWDAAVVYRRSESDPCLILRDTERFVGLDA